MDEDLRAALRPVAAGLRALTTAITALRDQLLMDAGRRDELFRRVEAQLDRIEPTIQASESPRVLEAREDLAVERLTLQRRMLAAPSTVGQWLIRDKARLLLLITTIGGLLTSISDGSPIIAAIGRALLAWGSSSAGGATP